MILSNQIRMPGVKLTHALFTEDEFQNLQQSFMEKYYIEFEDSEENKLSYTPIFNEYVRITLSFMPCVCHLLRWKCLIILYETLLFQIEILEKHLEQQLIERIPGFNMDAFTVSLKYVTYIFMLYQTCAKCS